MNTAVEIWRAPPAELTFPSDRIDIWRLRVDSDELPNEGLGSILAADEVARASRFHFDKDRNRYTRGRTALRILLGRYLAVAPGEIRFQYENHGKPEIAQPDNPRGLRFNSSDSGGLVLMAVTAGTVLGIDVERLRPVPDLVTIATRFFSAREVQALLAVSEGKRQEAFFACWTRKEAFLKATGVGLSYPLSAFSVTVDPDSPAEMLELGAEKDAAAKWSLRDLHPGEGYRAALAWEGGFRRIELWTFNPSPTFNTYDGGCGLETR
jgi:4'-phosphopantetheinyl transferase